MSNKEQIEELKRYKEVLEYLIEENKVVEQKENLEFDRPKVKVKRIVRKCRGKELEY